MDRIQRFPEQKEDSEHHAFAMIFDSASADECMGTCIHGQPELDTARFRRGNETTN
jgi:hypothetical protein